MLGLSTPTYGRVSGCLCDVRLRSSRSWSRLIESSFPLPMRQHFFFKDSVSLACSSCLASYAVRPCLGTGSFTFDLLLGVQPGIIRCLFSKCRTHGLGSVPQPFVIGHFPQENAPLRAI